MRLVFKNKKQEVGNIYSFYFASLEPVEWQAGQSIRLELETEYLIEERRFTISSAPSEKHIAITTNIGDSPFKQALAALKKGDAIDGHNIEGDFLLSDDSKPILLANGLGITPFRSQLDERFLSNQPLEADLIYSYQTGLAVFKAEFVEWQKKQPELNIKFISGQKLTADLVAELLPDFSKRLIYIAGSGQFISKVFTDLTKVYRVKPSSIRVDSLINI